MKIYLILPFVLICTASYSKETLAQKIIYSEASPLVASAHERYLVASVIKNRINHKHFKRGKLKTVNDVIKAKGAFVSYKTKNTNWNTIKDPRILTQIQHFLTNVSAYPDIVLYHDKSIKKPKTWKNVVRVCETNKFVFYAIKG